MSQPASHPGVRSARSGPKTVSGNTVEARDAAGRTPGRDPKGGALRPTGFVETLARCPRIVRSRARGTRDALRAAPALSAGERRAGRDIAENSGLGPCPSDEPDQAGHRPSDRGRRGDSDGGHVRPRRAADDPDPAHARCPQAGPQRRDLLAWRSPRRGRARDRHSAGGGVQRSRRAEPHDRLSRRWRWSNRTGVCRRHRHGPGARAGCQQAGPGARPAKRCRRADHQRRRLGRPADCLVHRLA